MDQTALCLHNGVAAVRDYEPGTRLEGVVVCVHVFGVGVYLPNVGDFGHVNVPELVGLSDRPLRELSDYPGVGTRLDLTVIGRTGVQRQLRLGRSPG